MVINKTRPKILPLVKIRNKFDLPFVCVVLSALWSHFEAVLASFRFRVVLPIRKY